MGGRTPSPARRDATDRPPDSARRSTPSISNDPNDFLYDDLGLPK